MNKKFDCIRMYCDDIKRTTESKQPHNNIEFVLSDNRIIKTLVLMADKVKHKRYVKSRFNDGRWAICPQNYEEFLDLLNTTSGVKIYQMYRRDLNEENNGSLYNLDRCTFNTLFQFAKEDLACADWTSSRREYLMRSFILECEKILDSKTVVTINYVEYGL